MKRKSKAMIRLILMILLFGQPWQAAAQWETNWPGGGRLFDVFVHPADSTSWWVCTDGGLFRTADAGATWREAEPQPPHRALLSLGLAGDAAWLVGAADGIYRSENQGASWERTTGTGQRPFAHFAIDPKRAGRVYALPGWLDWSVEERLGYPSDGVGRLYFSDDNGRSWSSSVYEPNPSSDKNGFSLAVDTATDRVYLAASAGIYRSADAGQSWEKLSNPSGTSACMGVGVSADGQRIYAAYDLSNGNHILYAASAQTLNWQIISFAGGIPTSGVRWWQPLVSTVGEAADELWVGAKEGEAGVYRARLSWTGNFLDLDFAWQQVFAPLSQGGFSTDHGWSLRQSPIRRLRLEGEQVQLIAGPGLYSANLQANGWPGHWQNRFAAPAAVWQVEGENQAAYRSTGLGGFWAQSAAGWEDFRAVSSSDGQLLESTDGGQSWISHLGKDWQVGQIHDLLVLETDQPVLLAACSGGDAGLGAIFAKPLGNDPLAQPWQLLAGGAGQKLNFPNRPCRRMVASAHQPGAVLIHLADAGLYELSVSAALINLSEWELISGNNLAIRFGEVSQIVPNPLNAHHIWLAIRSGEERGIYLGVRTGDEWLWERKIAGQTEGLALLQSGGQARPVAALKWTASANRPPGGSETQAQIVTSKDQGQSWQRLLSVAEAQAIHPLPDSWQSADPLDVGGLATHRNRLYVAFQSQQTHHRFSLLEGIDDAPSGQTRWLDFTANLPATPLAGLQRFAVRDTTYLFGLSQGHGLLSRIIDQPLATGLATPSQMPDCWLGPNPSTTLTRLYFAQTPSLPIRWELFNLLGNKVLAGVLADEPYAIRLENLPQGSYLLRLQSGEQHWQKRLMIRR